MERLFMEEEIMKEMLLAKLHMMFICGVYFLCGLFLGYIIWGVK